jgi:ribonuclease HII
MVEEAKHCTFPCQIIALDEAGRGPLAGPVVVAGVSVSVNSFDELLKIRNGLSQLGVQDSKKVSFKKRNEILKNLNLVSSAKNTIYQFEYEKMKVQVLWVAVSPKVIDKLNILQATLFGMKTITDHLVSTAKINPFHVLIDGNQLFKTDNKDLSLHGIVKGDQKSPFIGLASIIAKVARDELMTKLHKIYPQYGFDLHAGYPTKLHQEQLKFYGPSPIHRKSFRLQY